MPLRKMAADARVALYAQGTSSAAYHPSMKRLPASDVKPGTQAKAAEAIERPMMVLMAAIVLSVVTVVHSAIQWPQPAKVKRIEVRDFVDHDLSSAPNLHQTVSVLTPLLLTPWQPPACQLCCVLAAALSYAWRRSRRPRTSRGLTLHTCIQSQTQTRCGCC